MPSNLAVSLRGVGKRFKLYQNQRYRLMEILSLGRRQYHRDFWALKDIDLDIRRGEALGIIGANGAGKTTLLQIIAGILKATEGETRVRGRVGALLELGACFLPECTGEQNIRFFAGLLGLQDREIERQIPSIVDFADIGDFIKQPVSTYSQGMYLRLAFATAVTIKPDIVLIDEVLAVGDYDFRNKCYEAIRGLGEQTTMIIVTHDLNAVKTLAPTTVLLRRGTIAYTGPTDVAVDRYITESLSKQTSEPRGAEEGCVRCDEAVERFRISLDGEKGAGTTTLTWGERWTCRIEFHFRRPVKNSSLAFIIRTVEGIEVCGKRVTQKELGIDTLGRERPLGISFSGVAEFLPSKYFFVVILQDDISLQPPSFLYVDGRTLCFSVLPAKGPVYYGGLVNWPMTYQLIDQDDFA